MAADEEFDAEVASMAAESLDIDISTILLESLNIKPLSVLKERHPVKFQAEFPFLCVQQLRIAYSS